MAKTGGIAIVGGVPGVGKTTVINHCLKIAKEETFEIRHIIFGTVMMDIAKEQYDVHTRDDLRKLLPEDQVTLQKKAAETIAHLSRDKITIVDTHYTVKTGLGSFLQGIPKWVSERLKPNLLVLIETEVSDIIKRRKADFDRNRDKDSVEILKDQQAINKAVAIAICQQTGALLSIIENKQNKAVDAGQILFNHLRAINK
jgi:adenylate kinase